MVSVNDVSLKTEYANASVDNNKKTSALEISAFNVPGATNATSSDIKNIDLKKTRIEYIKQDIENSQNKISYNDALEVIKTAFGYEEKDLAALSEEEFTRVEEILLSILDHPAKNKAYNVTKAIKIAEFYKKSIENGNSYEQARSLVDNMGDMSILNILKAYNPNLNKYNSLSEIPKEELSAGLLKIVDKFKDTNDKKHLNKMFRNLLDRTSDEDKKILWEIFKDIAQSDEKVQMLTDTINKFENKEKLQNFLKSFTPEVIKALNLNENDIITVNSLITQNLDEDGVRQLQKLSFDFAEKINAKVQELKNKKPEEYTDDDKAALEALKYIKHSMAGILAGTQKNESLSIECKDEISYSIVKEAKDLNIYDDLLNNLAVYASEHQDQKLNEVLDKYTDGDFTKVYETYQTKIDIEKQDSSNKIGTTESSEIIGFAQTTVINPTECRESQQNKINTFYPKEDNKISIVKDNINERIATTPSLIGKSVTYLQKLIEENKITKEAAVKQSLKQYCQLSTSIKGWIENQVEQMSKGARYNILANTAGSTVVKIVSHTNINPDEIDTKTLGYDAKKAIEKIEENKPNIGLV